MARKKAQISKEKTTVILNAVGSGMAWDDAALTVGLSDAQIEALKSDGAFQREVRAQVAAQEKQMLDRHDVAIAEALARGNAAPAIQWRLGVLNPGRYGGKKIDAEGPDDLDLVLTIRKVRASNAD